LTPQYGVLVHTQNTKIERYNSPAL
jgi:hypothetical protein